MVETHPYEALSHAVLAWLEQNQARCDVVHAHEWGGVFVDVITSVAYRQLKPGACPDVCKHPGPLDLCSHAIQAGALMESMHEPGVTYETCWLHLRECP